MISDTANREEITCFTSIRWEVGCQVRLCDFLLQQICFVQEEDGGGLLEPFVREDGLEQGETLTESILKKEVRIDSDKRLMNRNGMK